MFGHKKAAAGASRLVVFGEGYSIAALMLSTM